MIDGMIIRQYDIHDWLADMIRVRKGGWQTLLQTIRESQTELVNFGGMQRLLGSSIENRQNLPIQQGNQSNLGPVKSTRPPG